MSAMGSLAPSWRPTRRSICVYASMSRRAGAAAEAAMSGRAECVMLNKGPNVGDAIDALESLLVRMAEHQTKKTSRLRMLHSW